MFSGLVLVFTFFFHRSEVLVGVDSAPPYGGLVHVLVIGHPDVKLVGVIELTAKGDLTLQMIGYLPTFEEGTPLPNRSDMTDPSQYN